MKFTDEEMIGFFKEKTITVIKARELIIGEKNSFKNSIPEHKAKYESIRDAVRIHNICMIVDGFGFTKNSSLETMSFFKWAIEKHPEFKAMLPEEIVTELTMERGSISTSFTLIRNWYNIPVPESYDELRKLYSKLFEDYLSLEKEKEKEIYYLKPLAEKYLIIKQQQIEAGKKSGRVRRGECENNEDTN